MAARERNRPAAKRAGRVASEGSVGRYIHAGGKLGVLVEVNCETDFFAKSEAFQTLVKEIAMQVAAVNPRVVRREEMPAEVIEQERQIYASQAEGKPAAVVGEDRRRQDREVLQGSVPARAALRARSRTGPINDLIGEAARQMREKIDVRRFVRFQLGENARRPRRTDYAAALTRSRICATARGFDDR